MNPGYFLGAPTCETLRHNPRIGVRLETYGEMNTVKDAKIIRWAGAAGAFCGGFLGGWIGSAVVSWIIN